MANRPAPALALRDGDREELSRITRSSSVRAGLAQRARIVLAAADGVANEQIAARVGVSKGTVLTWRGRYDLHGLAGLDDAPRSGRPRQVDHRRIVATTLAPPPAKLAPVFHDGADDGIAAWGESMTGRGCDVGPAGAAGLRFSGS